MIINPYATTVSDRLRNLVVSALASRYDVEAVETRARGHATELVAPAADGDYDVVVAFGGDGTVNEIANGLAGSPTPLTPLPGGSANVFCKLLGIPSDIVDATAHLLALADHWQPREVDLGFVAGRHYAFSAGVGIDASVVRQVDAHPALKRRYGPFYHGPCNAGRVCLQPGSQVLQHDIVGIGGRRQLERVLGVEHSAQSGRFAAGHTLGSGRGKLAGILFEAIEGFFLLHF